MSDHQGRDGKGSETELEVVESGGEGRVGDKNEMSDVSTSSFDMLQRLEWTGWSR